ncbi:uncharacterized protein LOC112596719 isoform X2 [Melanaphis sacchari]|uniref:uncharacterized protein LOC112596719 isoform X2 n=1 Tax=Melanaphis sacchari TaxID=742174 RepID=UPI000DC1570B|nr:uncharacterized protein LOC112596719 isoform X2 [Melanaphis sacchari]
MHILITSCLLIVCGIVDATFYLQRGQPFKQLNQRRQRSLGLPYPYGYNYNPIEPSIDISDSSSETFDSKINSYKPIHQYVKMSTHDTNSVPRTYSYPMNPFYDSEYTPIQNIPKLMPEDTYDYKYISEPWNKYLTQSLTPGSDNAIDLLSIRKQSAFSFGFPTYKFPDTLESVLNFDPKILSSFSANSQSEEMDPEISKIPSPTVIIVKLLPEKSEKSAEQESTAMITENPYNIKNYFLKLLTKKLIFTQKPVKDESIYAEETPTENDSNSMVFEDNPTEDESNAITTEDESNAITTEEESNAIPTEEESNAILTEEESNASATEENQTEVDESNPLTTQETITNSEANYLFKLYTVPDYQTHLGLLSSDSASDEN